MNIRERFDAVDDHHAVDTLNLEISTPVTLSLQDS